MKHTLLLTTLMSFGIFGMINCNSAKSDNFMNDAAQGGMAEVEMGKIAATKAQNPDLKTFAQKMVDDHTKAGGELKTLAAKKNVTLPTDVSSGQKSEIDKLNGLSGADFDKEYTKTMVADHKSTVELFQRQALNGTDEDTKTFASRTLPTIQMHLDMITNINGAK